MLETCLIALLAGAFFGWVIMRGWGWLCLAALLTVSAHAYDNITFHNTGNTTCYFWVRYNSNNDVWMNYIGVSGPGQTRVALVTPAAPGYSPGPGTTMKVTANLWAQPEVTCGTYNCDDYTSDTELDFYFNGSSGGQGTGNNSYFVSGCITNRGQLPLRFYYRDDTGYSEFSRLIPPNDFWCVSRTNANPGQYWIDQVVIDQEGGTNFNNQLGPYPFYTNTPPPTGGTGSSASIGAGPNNPIGAESGAGSTNGLTGAQYAAGISNMVNVNYSLNQALLDALHNNASSNDLTDRYLLEQIITNTALSARFHTNTLEPFAGMLADYAAMTNWLGTNFAAGSPWSNNAAAEGIAISNGMAGGVLSRVGSITGMTNVVQATEQDRSVWMMPIRTNVLSTQVSYIDLNPLGNPLVAGLMGWFRFGVKFWIQYLVFMYIYGSIKTSVFTVTGLEPGGPGRGGLWSILFYLKQNLFWGAMLASIPVLLLGALDSYFIQNPWVSCPFTSLGVENAAGAAAPYVRAGLDVLQGMFPLTFALSTLVWLLIWDVTQFGHVLFVTRLVKAVG